jgi:hypothetical protein
MVSDQIEEWQRLRRDVSRDSFIARFPHPFLIRSARPVRPGGEGDDKEGNDFKEPQVAFATGVIDAEGIGITRRPTLREAKILRVVKAPGNPYADRVSIGRAANCDIVIREQSVSKLHAHFKIDGDKVQLVDVRSANGTFVNGRRLDPLKPAPVESGDLLLFGLIAVQYLDAGKLWDVL